jgi:hypothetical protein
LKQKKIFFQGHEQYFKPIDAELLLAKEPSGPAQE